MTDIRPHLARLVPGVRDHRNRPTCECGLGDSHDVHDAHRAADAAEQSALVAQLEARRLGERHAGEVLDGWLARRPDRHDCPPSDPRETS